MRIAVAAVIACMSISSFAVATDARAALRQSTNIPAQPLSAALQTLAKSRDVQVVYVSEEINSRTTGGAAGELNFEEALTQLLKGTGLTYRYLNDRTVTIVPLPSGNGGANGAPATEVKQAPAGTESADAPHRTSIWDRFRLSQTEARKPQQAAASQDGEGVDEIVVTAQKREQRLIDVPMSIDAVSGAELQARHTTNMDDLAFAVAGLTVANDSQSTRVQLRGISNVTGNQSLVGMYLDEVSVTSAAYSQLDLRTYDLERVEVLRGPQGTLYGEGAVGGTIRFVTNAPDLNTFGMTGSFAALFTDDGAPGQRADAMINMPLVDGVFGLRVAGAFEHAGGWIDQPAANRRDFNEQNLVNVRAQALWQITPELKARAMAVIHRNDAPRNAGEDTTGDFTQVFGLATTPHAQSDYEIYNLTLSYDLGGATLLNSASTIDQTIDSYNYPGLTQIVAPPAAPFHFYSPFDGRDVDIFTDELRLTSKGAGPLQWTFGGFYRTFEFLETSPQNYFGAAGSPLPAPYPFEDGRQSDSWAVFGDASYQLTDRFLLGAGGRYFEDHQETTTGAFQEADFDAFSPRIYAQLRLSGDANLYVSAAKGFRSGGLNYAAGLPAYGPEDVWTYEAGAKFSALSGRLRADIALFYSDYRDYQIFGTVPLPTPLAITSNAGDAEIKGVEWSLLFRPASDWTVTLDGTLLDSKFTSINALSTSHDVGDPLDLFPDYSFSASLQRDVRWMDKPGYVRIDFSEHGPERYRNRNFSGSFGPPTPWYYDKSDVIQLLNVSGRLDWSRNLSFGLFAQNLLNDRGQSTPRSLEGNAGRPRPLTVGVEFSVAFD